MPRIAKRSKVRPTFEQATAMYVHRFTMEHVPAWSQQSFRQQGGTSDEYPAPQYVSDREWYERTLFPCDAAYAGIRGDCQSDNPSWPLGKTLNAPYPKR